MFEVTESDRAHWLESDDGQRMRLSGKGFEYSVRMLRLHAVVSRALGEHTKYEASEAWVKGLEELKERAESAEQKVKDLLKELRAAGTIHSLVGDVLRAARGVAFAQAASPDDWYKLLRAVDALNESGFPDIPVRTYTDEEADALFDKAGYAKEGPGYELLHKALMAVPAPTQAPQVDRVAERLETALRDFADSGTRHDLNPTLGWHDEASLGHAYLRYIKSMDDGVRERARAALGMVPMPPPPPFDDPFWVQKNPTRVPEGPKPSVSELHAIVTRNLAAAQSVMDAIPQPRKETAMDHLIRAVLILQGIIR